MLRTLILTLNLLSEVRRAMESAAVFFFKLKNDNSNDYTSYLLSIIIYNMMNNIIIY